jgi:hypothetical protein
LIRVQEQLKVIASNFSEIYNRKISDGIPDYKEWLVTMWHFGRDSLIEYAGQKFSITIGKAQNILIRIYAKEMNKGKMGIRFERQEYPQKIVIEAIEEKIDNQKTV